jgi:hypothetical protein
MAALNSIAGSRVCLLLPPPSLNMLDQVELTTAGK